MPQYSHCPFIPSLSVSETHPVDLKAPEKSGASFLSNVRTQSGRSTRLLLSRQFHQGLFRKHSRVGIHHQTAQRSNSESGRGEQGGG